MNIENFLYSFLLLVFLYCKKKDTISGDILIKNINIVSTETNSIIDSQNIVITDNRIIHISKNNTSYNYRVTTTIDGSNKYIIPGLWDMHAHPDDPEVWRMKPKETEKNLLMPLFIINGVTGIRDMGGDIELIKRWRQKSENGSLLVPRIFAGGPLLDGPNPMWDGSVGIDDPKDVSRVVDSLIKQGVDFLKVYSLLPRDTYLALSKYANKIHYPFVGHVPLTVSPSEAAETGMKSQEHLLEILKECADKPSEKFIINVKAMENGIDRSNAINTFRLSTFNERKADSLYALFAEKHIWHCPTLSMWYKNAWYEDELIKDKELLAYLPKYLQKYWTPEINDHLTNRDNSEFIEIKMKLYKQYLKMVKRMHEKGVKFLAGTDTGANPLCFPGEGVHNELKAFVDAGFTPFEALQTATINPAQFFEIENEYGSVKTGKVADLVILDDNPLIDIKNVKSIAYVIHNGNVIDRVEIENIKNNILKLYQKQ